MECCGCTSDDTKLRKLASGLKEKAEIQKDVNRLNFGQNLVG